MAHPENPDRAFLLAVDLSRDELIALAGRVREQAELFFIQELLPARVGLGLAHFPEDTASLDELEARATLALESALLGKGNRIFAIVADTAPPSGPEQAGHTAPRNPTAPRLSAGAARRMDEC